MQLTNTTSERVAFKVKTTSPKKYCVRPSSGIIEPNGFKEVQVIMQAQREAPISYSDCRDKFLVQCVKVGAGVSEVTSDLFDPAKGDGLRQTKLRVILIPPAKPPSPVPEGNESEPTSPGSACEYYNFEGCSCPFFSFMPTTLFNCFMDSCITQLNAIWYFSMQIRPPG